MSVASPSVELQPRDTAMFRGLYESRVMTIDQIAKLYFEGRREMARKRITKLKSSGFLAYRTKDSICSETIVTLAKAGYEQLVAAGAISDLPQLTWQKLQKRIDVGATVLKHELLVVDAKVAFSSAIASVGYQVAECSTWPALHAFESADSCGEVAAVYPDGFMRVEKSQGDAVYEACYFLEVDRSTERLDVLTERCIAYRHYYRSGGFAKRQGGRAEEYRNHYFRVLITCISPERARNIAAALMKLDQPIGTQVYLTTHSELMADPLGTIWLRPVDLETGAKQRLWNDEGSA